jgi:mannose-6-phosphate isomerase
MGKTHLYPLRFEPIYQYRLWGGRRLASLLSAPLPGDGPIGEAWVLSDRTDHQSQVANGPLRGQTLGQVIEQFRKPLMGKLSSRFTRFPLLLKFLDAHEMLSVQVHPSDDSSELVPAGDTAKTEAWVVIEAENGSHIYAGLRPGTTAGNLRQYSSLGERFTLWATMSWFSRFSKIAIRHFGFTIGDTSIRRPKSRGRCKLMRLLPA